MRITSIRTHVLRVPLGDKVFYSSQARFQERTSCLVRIETDSGITGWGEGGQYGPSKPVAAVINDVLAEQIVGEDPTQPCVIWERLYSFSRDFGQKGTYVEAMSAIDIALWDITGKETGQPIWKLLGGAFRSRVKAYATGCYYPASFQDLQKMLSDLKVEAAGYKNAGFDFLKIKVGLMNTKQDVQRVAAIREAVGPDVGIMVDANHAYTATTAIQLARQIVPYDIHFLEEPVVPEDKQGYRRVRAESPIPIAGGEAEYTRFGFRELLSGDCVDIAQPDLTVCGGFTAFSEILTLAKANGTLVIPHVWGSGIAVAAALHALAIIPPIPHSANPIPLQNEPIVEFDRTYNALRDSLLEHNFQLSEGYLDVPRGPGLGVSIDETKLEQFSQL